MLKIKLPIATTKALVQLAQQPQARLLIVNDCCFLLDSNTHEHKYIPCSAFSILREKEWITAPQTRGDQLAECAITVLGKAAATSILALQCQYTQLEFDLDVIDNHIKSIQLALFDTLQSEEEAPASPATTTITTEPLAGEHESQQVHTLMDTPQASIEPAVPQTQLQEQSQSHAVTLVDKVACYMPKRPDVIRVIVFGVSETAPDQIAKCHHVKRDGQDAYYLVESENIFNYRYKVQYTTRGFSCTCTSGKEQFLHIFHPSGVCPHVRWSVAASIEAKAAKLYIAAETQETQDQDKFVLAESQENHQVIPSTIVAGPQPSTQLTSEHAESQEIKPEELPQPQEHEVLVVQEEERPVQESQAQEQPAQKYQTETKYLTCADTAKIVRNELKKAFSSTKFSVRSSTYSMGASIDVKWTNGPTETSVQKIVRQYEGASFDSSQDLKTYHSSFYNGERVHFGADYIHTKRVYSVGALQEAASVYCCQYGYTVPAIKQSSYDGSAYIPHEEDILLETGMYLVQGIFRAAAQVDMTPALQLAPEQTKRKELEHDEKQQPPAVHMHRAKIEIESTSPIQWKGEPIAIEVLDVLKICDVDETSVMLPQRLERKLYLKVNDALGRIGGKWNKKAKTHLFEDDPRALFYWMLETGTQPPKNPTSYFPTSAHLAERMAAAIPVTAKRVLEPSAGTGNLARAIRDYCYWQKIDIQLDCCELVTTFQEKLTDQGFSLIASDFLQYNSQNGYDAIVMNPPFSLEGDPLAYITHIEHAWSLLNPGGVLVAIAPSGVTFRQDRRVKAFRELAERNGNWQDLEAGAFKEAGTLVNTVLLSMYKPLPQQPTPTDQEHQSQNQKTKGELSPRSWL